jgi:hypothetical protein
MAAKATVSFIDHTKGYLVVYGSVAVSGSFPNNGDTLDLSQLGVQSNSVPVSVDFQEATPAANKPAYGANWVYLPGTTQANGVLEAFNGTTQVTATGATYASLNLPTDFTLNFQAVFIPFR